MLTSSVTSGPLAGAQLTAAPSWDGRVRRPGKRGNSVAQTYPGRYAWCDGTWTWLADSDACDEVQRDGDA